jgi:hypothetical protein
MLEPAPDVDEKVHQEAREKRNSLAWWRTALALENKKRLLFGGISAVFVLYGACGRSKSPRRYIQAIAQHYERDE